MQLLYVPHVQQSLSAALVSSRGNFIFDFGLAAQYSFLLGSDEQNAGGDSGGKFPGVFGTVRDA